MSEDDEIIYVRDGQVINEKYKKNVKFLPFENEDKPTPTPKITIQSPIFESNVTFERIKCETNLDLKCQKNVMFSSCSIIVDTKDIKINYNLTIIDAEILNKNKEKKELISIHISNNKTLKITDVNINCNTLEVNDKSTLILSNYGSYPYINCNQIVLNGQSEIKNNGFRLVTNKLSLLNGRIENKVNTIIDQETNKKFGLFSTLIFSILEYKKGEIINEQGCFVITPSKNCKLSKIIKNQENGYYLNFQKNEIVIQQNKNEKNEKNEKKVVKEVKESYQNIEKKSTSYIYLMIFISIILILLYIFYAYIYNKIN